MTWHLSLKPDSDLTSRPREMKERREPCYCGPKSLTCRENWLTTPSPHSSIDDDTAKSMCMRCVGSVGLEDRPKRFPGLQLRLQIGV